VLINVHLLGNKLYEYQKVSCNDKNVQVLCFIVKGIFVNILFQNHFQFVRIKYIIT